MVTLWIALGLAALLLMLWLMVVGAVPEQSPPSIAFLHPDLGIGGAERLVVDAAVALQRKGHRVEVFTAHHDPTHCFEETRDGTLKVTVYGDWLPRTVFGKGWALCAYFRMVYVAVVVLLVQRPRFSVLFCDQISVCLPLLRLSSSKTVFYCHFPDMLLTQRKSLLKRLYRAPIDWVEEWTTGMAHSVLVNSNFTKRTFADTFKSLQITPGVLYPSLIFDALDKVDPMVDIDRLVPAEPEIVFLSINRFERKKNLKLAVEALATLKSTLDDAPELWSKVHLVIAGGYDKQLPENVEHHQELVDYVEEHGLVNNITFLRSFTDGEKVALLKRCTCLVYTPSNEHFGIVPLEAMYSNRCVIAVNSGGPLETIKADPVGSECRVKDQTGFLCDPIPAEFASAMEAFVRQPNLATSFGAQGHARVTKLFSFEAFAKQLENVILAAGK